MYVKENQIEKKKRLKLQGNPKFDINYKNGKKTKGKLNWFIHCLGSSFAEDFIILQAKEKRRE